MREREGKSPQRRASTSARARAQTQCGNVVKQPGQRGRKADEERLETFTNTRTHVHANHPSWEWIQFEPLEDRGTQARWPRASYCRIHPCLAPRFLLFLNFSPWPCPFSSFSRPPRSFGLPLLFFHFTLRLNQSGCLPSKEMCLNVRRLNILFFLNTRMLPSSLQKFLLSRITNKRYVFFYIRTFSYLGVKPPLRVAKMKYER